MVTPPELPPHKGSFSGLPAIAPDFVEQDAPTEIDQIVPSLGYSNTPMVGLGGSAGSLVALQKFFGAMPTDSGMSFVVILHLSPTRESALDEVLGRATKMPVVKAEDGQKVQANHVYVIPPAKHLTTTDGHLRLSDLDNEVGRRVAVDLFFRSLADTQGPHAAAIVLSGADGDGAQGVKRIKERGGLTIAQDPEEAEHGSMPRTAIDTGMVDWILQVADIPRRLMAYRDQEKALKLPPEEGPQPAQVAAPTADQGEAALREVLTFLRTRTGRDFSYYKRATIVRRIARRMQINGVTDMPAYLAFLRAHVGEAGALLQDLLISVTNFFRDRDSFDVLQKNVAPLFQNKGANDAVRVWVPACATGEEAYSIAILLLEYARGLSTPPAIQVFACDLDEDAIQQARAGLYPESITADVSEERLRSFFVKDQRGYRVRRELREMVLFAVHDLLKDAPFSRLDLISCRNLLIYLNRDAQKRVFDTFHFALRPEGFLFLGSSESIAEGSPLFRVLDKNHRLYAHEPAPRTGFPVPSGPSTLQRALEAQDRATGEMAMAGQRFFHSPVSHFPAASAAADRATMAEIHFKLIERFASPSVVVDADHHILHLSENAGRFLQLAGGPPSADLLHIVHPSLRAELRATLFRAAESKAAVQASHLALNLDGSPRLVNLTVTPANDLAPGCLLVVFEARERGGDNPLSSAVAALPPEPVIRQLERELEHVKSHLRDTVEQHAASSEEMKASNEELQAMNEELRSASEELETSREELQSINEELTTVNQEMKVKVDELAHTNSDLQNLMAATAIPTVFLDRELAITRYTPAAIDLFYLIPSDVGRPLGHIKHRVHYPEILTDAERVLRTLVPAEREVRNEGRWFLARLQPYRTLEDHIAGVVLTFVDVTERKRFDEALGLSEERLRLLVESARDYAIFTTDPERRVSSWNTGAEAMLGFSEKEILGQSGDLIFTPEDRAKGDAIREAQTADKQGRATNERWHLRKDGTRLYGSGMVRPLRSASGALIGFVKIMRDLTEQKQAEEKLQESEERLRTLSDSVPQLIWTNDSEGAASYFNRRWHEYTGLNFEQSVGLGWQAIVHPDDAAASKERWKQALAAGTTFDSEYRLRDADGKYHWFIGRNVPLRNADGQVSGWFGTATDIHELKEAQAAIIDREEHFRRAVEDAPIPIIMHADDGQVLQVSRTWTELTGYTHEDIPTFDAWLNRAYGYGADAVRESMKEVFKGDGRLRRFDLQIVTRGGERRDWVFTTSAPGALRDGRRFAVGMVVDMTERIRAERGLRESEERLRDADRRKNQFLAMLGHELRNPLAAIRGGIALLSSDKTKPATRAKTLPVVAEQVGHMERLVDDLLDVTRIVEGQLKVRQERVTVQQTLSNALEMVRVQAEAGKFKLRISIPPEPLTVLADPVRLTQIFVNVLVNALKYSGEARQVDITASKQADNVSISIRDYGLGIPPDLLPRIFEPFVQAKPTVTLDGGLGLGLAVVRQLVTLHGGRVEAFSRGELQGSEFIIHLPLAPASS